MPHILSVIGAYVGYGLLALVLAILAFGIIARIIWWQSNHKMYFPSVRPCVVVHKNLPRWWRVVRGHRPGSALAGFGTFVVWPFLVCLNVLLLAQVFELFMPGGQRIPLPWVGKYAVGTLIAGVLYAVSQAVMSIIYGVAESPKTKRSLFGVLALTVLVEMGLAFWRTRMLTAGTEPVSPSLMDQVMVTGGPFLAMFMGLIVPIAEAICSFWGFHKFVEPAVVFLFTASAWWTLGFHDETPIILEQPVSGIKRQVDDLEETVESVNELLQRELSTPIAMPATLGQLDKQREPLRHQAAATCEAWRESDAGLQKAIAGATTVAELREHEKAMVHHRADIREQTEALGARMAEHEDQLRGLRSACAECRQALQERLAELKSAQTKLIDIGGAQGGSNGGGQLAVVRKRVARVQEVLQTGTCSTVDPLTQAEVQNLRRIMATAGVLPGEARSAVGESIPTGDSLEAGWARHELNGWTGAVQSADTVLGTLAVTVAQLMKQTEGLQRQGEEALRKVSEPLEDDDINSRLVELQSQYSKLEADTQQALANCAARAGQLARRQADLRRTPWWLRWVYALVPTDWFGPNGSGK